MIKNILILAVIGLVIWVILPYIYNYVKFNILYYNQQLKHRWIIECPSCHKPTNYSHKQITDVDFNISDKEFRCSCCGYVIASKNDPYDSRLRKVKFKAKDLQIKF